MPKETCIHLALSALSLLQASDTSVSPSAESIRAKIQSIVGQSTELPDEADDAIGEIARAPFSELPNTAAFLGGMVAQEVIKMITKQYVPVKGYCVIDLIETWTGTIGA